MSEDNRKRLGREVIARRTELGMKTTKALAEKAKLSPRMLGDVENGRRQNFSPGAKAQIEHALGWMYGSIGDVLAGLQPTPIDPARTSPAPGQGGPVSTQLWSTVGDLSSRLGISLRAQAALFRWTQERLPEADHAEHERMAGAAANPLMSASMDYLQQGMAASAARDPEAAADPDFIRLSETAKRIKQESEQADAVEATTESDASSQAQQAQEEASLDESEAAAAASVTSRLKAMKGDGGLHNPDDPRKQRG